MKLGVYKSYELDIYGDLDINIEEYVEWLDSEKPSRYNLQEYIEEELEFNKNLLVEVFNVDLDYNIDEWDSISFPGACQYKEILDEAEKLQNELKAETQTLE